MTASDAAPPPNTNSNRQDRAPLLSFGTQVVIDARAVAARATNSEELASQLVNTLVARVEQDSSDADAPMRSFVRAFTAADGLAADGPVAGVSAIAARGETAISLHTFTDLSRVNLRLVSALSVPIDVVISEFKRAFSILRYRSHVSSRYRTFPGSDEQLERFLIGERAYTRLRLDEPLAP